MGACAPATNRTIKQYMDGLYRSRHSACLLDPRPDLRLGRGAELEMADDAVLVHEERARQAQHAKAPRRGAVAIEDQLQAIEPERLEKGTSLVGRLHEIDLEHDEVRLAGGHALQRGHL